MVKGIFLMTLYYQINNKLYFGSSILPENVMIELQINKIINCGDHRHADPSIESYMIKDGDEFSFLENMDNIVESIKNHISSYQTVYIYCESSLSIVSSIIIYYLIRYYNAGYRNAINTLQNKNKDIIIHPEFETILTSPQFFN